MIWQSYRDPKFVLAVIRSSFTILWAVSFLVFWIIQVWSRFAKKNELNSRPVVLVIAAGLKGWESIEFKELFQSATEYLGKSAVRRQIVSPDSSFLKQFLDLLKGDAPSHFLFDPRTGSQNLVEALWQAFVIGCALSARGIVPIAYAADISLRRWRLQCAIVTAFDGVCVSFADFRVAERFFPHKRLIGPSLMPFSQKTAEELSRKAASMERSRIHGAAFFGSLYEPRRSTLVAIQAAFAGMGISFEIGGRQLGGQRVSVGDYWAELMKAKILITTTSQVFGPGMDFRETNQLVYRCLEALICKNALLIEDVPGIERYFRNGIDLITFGRIENVVSTTSELLTDPIRLQNLRKNGHKRALELIGSFRFWEEINGSLAATKKLRATR